MEQMSMIEKIWDSVGEFSGNLLDWFAPCSKRSREAMKSCALKRLSAEVRGASADEIISESTEILKR